MDTPEKKPKTPKQGTESDDKLKRSLEISKMIYPHDDKPDPTANQCNYNFPQLLLAFCLGFTSMFVLSVDEIRNFKGCPLPEYQTKTS